MGDENECILPIPCTIQTKQDSGPEDDDMRPSAVNTLMDKLGKMNGIDMEVSGTMSNTDCALPTEEDDRLLENIRKSKAGKGKGATINWSAFSESPISEYGEKRVLCMMFPSLYPVGNGDFNKCRPVDIIVKNWARQHMFLDHGRFAKDKTWCLYALNYAESRRNMTQGQLFVNNLLHSWEVQCIDTLKDKLKK
jgi:hypothetical protein